MSETVVSRRRALTMLCALGVASSSLAQAATTAAPGCVAGHADGLRTSDSFDATTGAADCVGFARLADGIDASAIDELAREFRAGRASGSDSAAIADLLNDASGQDVIVVRLRERLTRDYVDGRIVELSGWWISRTEAALFVALSDCRQNG